MPGIPYILTSDNTLSIYLNSKPTLVSLNDKGPEFIKELVTLMNEGKGDEVLLLLDRYAALVAKTEGKVTIKNNKVYWNDEVMNNTVANRLLQSVELGLDYEPIEQFIIRCKRNPSQESVDLLYEFLEHNHLPITANGTILAYKGVNPAYRDYHTNSFDNSVGVVNSMDRNLVDPDPTVGCSRGFHVGTIKYVNETFRDARVIICEVNPEDVVCVPSDLQYQKIRTCKYTVVGEFIDKLPDVQINYEESKSLISNYVGTKFGEPYSDTLDYEEEKYYDTDGEEDDYSDEPDDEDTTDDYGDELVETPEPEKEVVPAVVVKTRPSRRKKIVAPEETLSADAEVVVAEEKVVPVVKKRSHKKKVSAVEN